jgi:hypothetical protein
MHVDLFVSLVPEARFHKNFRSVLVPFRETERDLLNKWSEGFVDRDGKLIEEFQTTFNSTFWEIYLYAAFNEYGFQIDWTHASPDFSLRYKSSDFIVEGTTANSADGKPSEWDKTFTSEELSSRNWTKQLNTEAIIRLSNAIVSKARKYQTSYLQKKHVKGKPFVIAVAPFEQPHFQLQYDRAIRALLYDYYVDEDIFLSNPDAYPNGPPVVNLGFVEKDNGAEIPLGIFNDSGMEEVSAIIFSCTATWGKLSAMSESNNTLVSSLWATPPRGEPERRVKTAREHQESIIDGLQIYHNPFAKHPLSPSVFNAPRVVQHYFDHDSGLWVYEGSTDALLFRHVVIRKTT